MLSCWHVFRFRYGLSCGCSRIFACMAASQALPVMFRGLWRALGRPALVVRASNRTWKQEAAPPGLRWQSCKNCTWWKEGPLIHSVVSSACLKTSLRYMSVGRSPGRRFDRENAKYCKPGRRFDCENVRFCGPGRRFDSENTWFYGRGHR